MAEKNQDDHVSSASFISTAEDWLPMKIPFMMKVTGNVQGHYGFAYLGSPTPVV